MKVFATHNRDEAIRLGSSSGGAFTTLAEEVVRQGGVVYGAAFDADWRVAHRRVTTLDGLALLRGSKYVYSHVGEAYSQAMDDLAVGREVLFSGTPCQVAAMRKRAGDAPRLLLVEVVCHGAPEPKYWDMYLAELCRKHHRSLSDIVSINFRDKRTGWKNYHFTIGFTNGAELSEFHGENLYMRGLLYNLTLRAGCFRCPFKYPTGSHADITLGDFWGVKDVCPEMDDDKGLSLVIARTPEGVRRVECLPVLKEITFEEGIIKNKAVVEPAKWNDRQAEFDRLIEKSGYSAAIEKVTRPSLKIRVAETLSRVLKLLSKSRSIQ